MCVYNFASLGDITPLIPSSPAHHHHHYSLPPTEASSPHQQLGVSASTLRQPLYADDEGEEGGGAGDHAASVQRHGEPAQHLHHQQAEGGDAEAAGDEGEGVGMLVVVREMMMEELVMVVMVVMMQDVVVMVRRW